VNNTDESFYRRFTLPEELKNRDSLSNEWRGSYRWFASANVVKLEDYRPAGEMARALERLPAESATRLGRRSATSLKKQKGVGVSELARPHRIPH
jgi:hypothetical protein